MNEQSRMPHLRQKRLLQVEYVGKHNYQCYTGVNQIVVQPRRVTVHTERV